ncbi:jun-like transcription factor [Scheffersomyces coipomensis]|uniref:jun-like transcription factor n=1 Tax=Scheffersomyces coipomensis TaxID=1788519 RepID=UPI00315CF8F1
MSSKTSIAPRVYGSPIAIAGASPPATVSTPSGATPRPIASNLIKPGATPPSTASSPAESIGAQSPPVMNSPAFSQIITSKEWVLPPRPKPGRKPSVDTPASKRKAQNRAAQRAFRERRATRVQELEEKLMEQEKEKEVKELSLINTINKLKQENQFLIKSLESIKTEITSIKSNQSKSNTPQQQRTPSSQQLQPQPSEPQSTTTTTNNQRTFKATFSLGGGGASSHNSPINQVVSSPAGSIYSIQQQISPAPSADSPPGSNYSQTSYVRRKSSTNNIPTSRRIDTNNFDCGVCLKDECLCEAIGIKESKSEETKQQEIESQKILDEKLKSFKPMAAVSLGGSKKRSINSVNQETDFTDKFKFVKKVPDLKKLKSVRSPHHGHNHNQTAQATQTNQNFDFNENSPVENCGFCSDDTPCVCREAAKEAAILSNNLNQQTVEVDNDNIEVEEHKALPPLQNINMNNGFRKSSLPVMHPGPSVEISNITNLTPGAVPNVVTPTTRRSDSVANSASSTDLITLSTAAAASTSDNNDNSGCTGNPGTCKQCQTDPLSTLFCTTVANKDKNLSKIINQSSLSRSNSRTNLPSFNELSTNQSSTAPSTPNMLPSTPGPSSLSSSVSASGTSNIFIPCADAYKTLSRHKNFNSADFSTMVGKLTTRGMQVEVQSVANVLRELDRRLYS